MAKQFDMAIIGGDMRQIYMANLLIERGFSIIIYGLNSNTLSKSIVKATSLHEAISKSKIIIGPIPFSRDHIHINSMDSFDDLTIEAFESELTPHHTVFAGSIDKNLIDFCNNHDILIYDFMDFNEVSILNAISTAEGTIMEAIKNSNLNLHGSNTLVLGYGRCAKVLAKKLQGLDAKICIAARKPEDRYLANAYGYSAISLTDLLEEVSKYDYIINTIPALILDRTVLSNIKKEATIIDIASAPGGTDFAAAKELGLNANLCLGLPGKYAPSTSADILVNAMIHILKESSD